MKTLNGFSKKTRIKQAFSLAAQSYDQVAELQREVGGQLLSRIAAEGLEGWLLDLGCGTGFLTDGLLRQTGSRQIIALDLAFAMLQVAHSKLAGTGRLRYICADAENLPLATASLDGVMSNLALQWCGRLDRAFADIGRVLKPGGRLVFSTFGDGTLLELENAWAQVDDDRHVNEFYTQQQLQQLLREADFRNIDCHGTLYQSHYGGIMDLLRELKQLGARTVITRRTRHLTGKQRLQAMMDAYQQQGNGPITASFHVITVTANR